MNKFVRFSGVVWRSIGELVAMLALMVLIGFACAVLVALSGIVFR